MFWGMKISSYSHMHLLVLACVPLCPCLRVVRCCCRPRPPEGETLHRCPAPALPPSSPCSPADMPSCLFASFSPIKAHECLYIICILKWSVAATLSLNDNVPNDTLCNIAVAEVQRRSASARLNVMVDTWPKESYYEMRSCSPAHSPPRSGTRGHPLCPKRWPCPPPAQERSDKGGENRNILVDQLIYCLYL